MKDATRERALLVRVLTGESFELVMIPTSLMVAREKLGARENFAWESTPRQRANGAGAYSPHAQGSGRGSGVTPSSGLGDGMCTARLLPHMIATFLVLPIALPAGLT